ncbi:hypothetical protein PINS_up015978 [Pythium insidiosum]|nr:hypothetical protein PINS_up015978 [Pythium insidiosum]
MTALRLTTLSTARDKERIAASFPDAARLWSHDATDESFLVFSSPGDDDALIGVVIAALCQHDTELLIKRIDAAEAAQPQSDLELQILQSVVRHVVEVLPLVKRLSASVMAPDVERYVRCGFVAERSDPNDPQRLFLALDCHAARRLPVFHVDAFSSTVFDGNPAAVVVMPHSEFRQEGVSSWMMNVAKENNLRETAFVARREEAKTDRSTIVNFDMRWFKPRRCSMFFRVLLSLKGRLLISCLVY